MEVLIGEFALSLLGRAAVELVKQAFKETRGRPRGRQMVMDVAAAVRDPRCLMAAIRRRDVELLHGLLKLGADVHVNTGHRLRLRHFATGRMGEVAGFTPLMLAVLADDPRMIRLLLHYGACIDGRCSQGDGSRVTAIVVAAAYGRLRAAAVLLDEGADASSYRSPTRGLTLVAWCRARGDSRMAALLSRYV